MSTFKAVYKLGGIYFERDIITNIQLYIIDFNDIEKYLGISNIVLKCDINTPINKIYKLCIEKDKINFTIQFNDHLCTLRNGNLVLSNDIFNKKIIEFNDISIIVDNDSLISSEELVNIYIQNIENINIYNNIIKNIKLLKNIYERTKYDNIYNSKYYNRLCNILNKKTHDILNILENNIIHEEDNSLISELLVIAKLKNVYFESNFNVDYYYYNSKNNYQKNKILLLLNKIEKIINDNYKICSYKIDLMKYKNKKYEASKNLYYSSITRTNWIDEIEYGNITGLLLKIDPKEINKNAYNMDYIPIMDITHTIISLEQILEAYKIFYETHKTLFDNQTTENIISGFGIGTGNCIIPLYISSDHWNLVKLYHDYNNGIIFYRNPLISKIKHMDVYYNIMLNMINLTFSNNNYNSDKWIQLLFSMLRTVYEISKFDSQIINKFKYDKYFRVESNINKILILMLFNNDDECIKYVIEEQIRRKMKSIYRNISCLDNIYKFNKINIVNSLLYEYNHISNIHMPGIDITEFNELKSNLEDKRIFSKLITTIHSIITMRNIIKNDYNIFFEEMDVLCGVLEEKTLYNIKKKIINNLIKPTNYKLKSILNKKFVSHINITKKKKFRMDTLYNNNIITTENQLKALLIQCIMQRVNKSRKRALKNKKYNDPFKDSKTIIENTGILISSRAIRNHYKLDNNLNNYINCINMFSDDSMEFILFLLHIRKTVSIKNRIINNIVLIKSIKKKSIILNLYNKSKLPNEYLQFNILLK